MRPHERKAKPLDDEKLIELFFERSEQAIAELSRKYGHIFMKIALNALGDRRDAEECVNDALMAVWNAVPPARPKPLLAYAARIVRNIAVNRWHSRGKKHPASGYELCLDELEGLFSDSGSPEEALEGKQLTEMIESFLSEESELNRLIFVRRFWYMDSCEELAAALGMRPGAVRTRLSRIKSKLKTFLKEKGVEV